jgi:hypothetical protein
MCICCNVVKGAMEYIQAQVVVGWLGRERNLRLDARGHLCARPANRFTPNAVTLAELTEWSRRMCRRWKRSAVKRGYEFRITVDYVLDLLLER